MTQPIDLAERQALATPRDWPQDFAADHGWQVCDWCLRLFLGATPRIRCRECETLHGRPA